MKTKSMVVLFSMILLCQSAFAGPPLLCHPFEIGSARSLPWAGPNWKDVKLDYDVQRLANDTLALLTAETPVIARMETLRRAAVYVERNPNLATELFSKLQQRIDGARGKGGNAEALTLFDLGYFAETYKQYPRTQTNLIDVNIEGLPMVSKAIELRGSDAEMEFAAAVMAVYPKDPSQPEHLRKAVAGARSNTLLARNIASHFENIGK